MTDRRSLFINRPGGFIHHDQALGVHPSVAEIQPDQIEALCHQLDMRLDIPVAARLAMNTLERAIGCSYICLLVHEPEGREFVALASAGRWQN